MIIKRGPQRVPRANIDMMELRVLLSINSYTRGAFKWIFFAGMGCRDGKSIQFSMF